MTDTDTAELERQAEEARVRLSDTADKLRARMSPGQLMDELMGQFRDGDSGAMLANLRTQVRDNPMALALIGSGVAWLLAGNGAAAPAKSSGSAADLGAFTSVSGDRAPLRSAAEPDTSGGEAGSGPATAARKTIRSGLEAAGDMASDAKAAGTTAASEVKQAAGDIAGQAGRTFRDMLDREPLVIAALGIAAGAAVGALLPATDLERDHLGGPAAQLRDKAKEMVDRGMEAARDIAGDVAAKVQGDDLPDTMAGGAPAREGTASLAEPQSERA